MPIIAAVEGPLLSPNRTCLEKQVSYAWALAKNMVIVIDLIKNWVLVIGGSKIFKNAILS